MVDVAVFEKKLRDRLTYLDQQVHKIENELETQPDPDWEENAQAHEQDEVLEEMGNLDEHEMRAIHAALKRIKDGSYGQCVSCEDDISEARLELVPHTPFCKDCVPK